jgi:hypothetical protein
MLGGAGLVFSVFSIHAIKAAGKGGDRNRVLYPGKGTGERGEHTMAVFSSDAGAALRTHEERTMSRTTQIMIPLLVLAVLTLPWSAAVGDPLPGEVLKFQQLPMVATQIGGQVYSGHDEWSTAYGVRGPAGTTPPWTFESIDTGLPTTYMADDFADELDTPVVHVRWWGSYQGDEVFKGVQQFLISFENDVPAQPDNPDSFSHPDLTGPDNLHQIVYRGLLAPGSGTFTETPIFTPPAGGGETIYEYNAELACPFPERPDTVYWLKIVALVDPVQDNAIVWGWHNRDYTVQDLLASTPPAVFPGEYGTGLADGTTIWHFQDDAVVDNLLRVQSNPNSPCGAVVLQEGGFVPQTYLPPLDGPSEIGLFSKDLAFELHTIPEPSTLVLIAAGLLGLLAHAWRQRARA